MTLAVLAALYLIGGNVLLSTRLLRHATNVHPDELFLEYSSAYTILPGRVKVKDLKLRFQDRSVAFDLGLDAATVQISLHELFFKRFHATQVRVAGVSWRMFHKVRKIEGQEDRVAAFPVIEGFDGPPIVEPPPPGPPSTGEGVWSVRLDDVEGDVREVWMLEYRYVGAGHVVGAFEMRPMRSVWVGPATLVLEEGTLSAGPHVLSKNFAMKTQCTIAMADIPASPGLLILRTLTTSVQITADLASVGAAQLYRRGLQTSGNGSLSADLRVSEGRLTAGSKIEARLKELKLQAEGAGFNGTVNVAFKLAPDSKGVDVPVAHAAAAGTVRMPIPDQAAVAAVLSDTSADVSFDSADLAAGPGLEWLHAELNARVEDASAITAAAAQKAPFIAPAVLGKGPLVVSGTADVTPGKVLLRLKHASLGDAELAGTAVKAGQAWNGVASGRVAVVPVGLLLKSDALEVKPFIKDGWLAAELPKLGLEAKVPVR